MSYDRTRLRTRLRNRWLPALATVAFISTVIIAAAALAAVRRAEGIAPQWPILLLWQALVFGTWIPVGWLLSRLVTRLGLTGRLVALLYAMGPPVTAAHAALAATFDVVFSPRLEWGDLGRLLLGRAPVDVLIYVAMATLTAAVHAQRRAAFEAERAAALADMLQTARRALDERQLAAVEGAERLLVSTGTKQVVVQTGEVEWFGSAGNYVVVNWNKREGLIRQTLVSLERRLDPAIFARSHRSTIVNLARVQAAASLSDGSWRLTMESGSELVVSRTYRDEFLSRLRG